MDKVLIIGAGDFQLSLVKEASELYQVYLCAPEIDERFTPFISGKLLCDVRDMDKILAYAREKGIAGVLTDGTDIAVRSVAYVAEQMGLPGIGYGTACLFSEKHLMRDAMLKLGIPVIPFTSGKTASEVTDFVQGNGFPLIVKPTDSQGSRGITKVDDKEQLYEAFAHAAQYSSDGSVIVEKYIVGEEMVVEAATVDHQTTNLICGDTIYFEDNKAFAAKSRTFPSIRDAEKCRRVLELNQKIVEGFGLKFGITHGEYIFDGEQPYLIEIAARGGGVFISSDIIEIGSGLNTQKFLLDLATGGNAQLKTAKQDVYVGYRAFFLPKGQVVSVKGIDETVRLPFVGANQLDQIKEGMVIQGNVDKTTRFAMVVTGSDYEDWQGNVERIKNILDVKVLRDGKLESIIWD